MNNNKINEAKSVFGKLDMEDEDFFYFLYEDVFCRGYHNDKIYYINEGSERTAYELKGTNICMKFSKLFDEDDDIEYSYDEAIDTQGAIEIAMYENTEFWQDMTEIYGYSNNYCVILSELCQDGIKNKDLYNHEESWVKESFLEKFEKQYSDCAEPGESKEHYLSEVLEEYLDCGYEYDDILADMFIELADMYMDNLGVSLKDGSIKILDAGYGFGEEYRDEIILGLAELYPDKKFFNLGSTCSYDVYVKLANNR